MNPIILCLVQPELPLDRGALGLLGKGLELAAPTGQPLELLVLGHGLEGTIRELASYGPSAIHSVDHPLLAAYQAEICLEALVRVLKEVAPTHVLMGNDWKSQELAPGLAFRLEGCMVADCVDIECESGGETRLFKPVYGGKAHATFVPERSPTVATSRTRSFQPAEKAAGQPAEKAAGSPTLRPWTLPLEQIPTRLRSIEQKEEEKEGIQLEDAHVIVSGGRGIGGTEGFTPLEQLAKLLGGTVGASRVACDSGWVAPSLQVGQTGKKVCPELYIAVGISGASQHMAGISGTRHIVAINTDGDAPIFRSAELGVIEDWKAIVPQLISLLGEGSGKQDL